VRHNVCEQNGVETDPPGGRKAALFGRVDQRTGELNPPTMQTLILPIPPTSQLFSIFPFKVDRRLG
jgi:hypothetical protein